MAISNDARATKIIQLVKVAIASDGEDPELATIEVVHWRRTDRFVGAASTVALLSGRHRVYVAGENAADAVSVSVLDKGTGKLIGTFKVPRDDGKRTVEFTLDEPSICRITVQPSASVLGSRVVAYDVVLGIY
jgi:hypothetical protein